MRHRPPPTDTWGPLPPHAAPAQTSRRSASTWLERLLFLIAVVCLGYYAVAHAETYLYQRMEERELAAILTSRTNVSASPTSPSGDAGVSRPAPGPGSTIGRIEIARLGVSAIVRAGSDARTLSLAVGHIPGTARPGDPGNAGLAAHRDTFFKRLGDIRSGDTITITTADGVFAYDVERTLIVAPSDVWVLDQTPQTVLTLVTCYPFTYVGAAPQRFIVRAALRR